MVTCANEARKWTLTFSLALGLVGDGSKIDLLEFCVSTYPRSRGKAPTSLRQGRREATTFQGGNHFQFVHGVTNLLDPKKIKHITTFLLLRGVICTGRKWVSFLRPTCPPDGIFSWKKETLNNCFGTQILICCAIIQKTEELSKTTAHSILGCTQFCGIPMPSSRSMRQN